MPKKFHFEKLEKPKKTLKKTQKTLKRWFQFRKLFAELRKNFPKFNLKGKSKIKKTPRRKLQEGSTKLEREVYERYLYQSYRDFGVDLANKVARMSGRLQEYLNNIDKVIQKYNLPRIE